MFLMGAIHLPTNFSGAKGVEWTLTVLLKFGAVSSDLKKKFPSYVFIVQQLEKCCCGCVRSLWKKEKSFGKSGMERNDLAVSLVSSPLDRSVFSFFLLQISLFPLPSVILYFSPPLFLPPPSPQLYAFKVTGLSII